MFRGWSVVAVCMLVFGVSNGITAYSYGVLVFPMGAEFGAGRGELMLGLTVSSLVSIVLAPLLGGLVDKGQARLLFSGAALLLGLELLLISFASSVWAFVAVFALATPVVSTLLGPVGTNTVVARWFSRQRARALGILAMGTSIGGLLVPLLLQTLIDEFGWRTACRWMALLVPVLLVPCVMAVIRNRPQDLGLHPDGDTQAAQHAAAQDASAPMPAVFRDIVFWRISFAVGVLMAAFTAALANLVPFAIGQGVSGAPAAALMSALAAAGLGGKILFSVFATRINLKFALLAALVLVGLPLASLTVWHAYVAMVAAAVCLGLASGAFLPAWSAIVARIYGPAVFGRVMGRMQSVTIPAVMVGTPATGYLFDLTGSYDTAFLMFTAAAALAIAVLMPLRVPEQHA
jgi:predicted MFS family arabinose efflux permease